MGSRAAGAWWWAAHLEQVEEVLVRLQLPPLAFAQALDAVAVSGVRLLLALLVLHLLTVGDHVLSAGNRHSSSADEEEGKTLSLSGK